MFPKSRSVSLTFVWRAKEIISAVIEQARNNGVRALFDLSSDPLGKAAELLLMADAAADCADVKLSSSHFAGNSVEEFISETGLKRVWVEIDPLSDECDTEITLKRISEIGSSLTVIPILSDPKLISSVLKNYPDIGAIGLKGAESSGFVGSESAFNLFATTCGMLCKMDNPVDLYIWGSVARPELAASFLSAGAKGIVFESLHWATDLVDASPEVKQKISGIKLDHTDLVGGNLGVFCRLYNKGNSRAVKELKAFSGSLCGSEIGTAERSSFTQRIQGQALHALDSDFGRDEMIPLGVEASFAGQFASEYGLDTEKAIGSFVKKVSHCLDRAPTLSNKFVDSAVAAEMGTIYPFIQGAMSWITDVPEFALKVAEAGAMPTIALGLMNGDILRQKLGSLATVMNNKPFAVNVITLMENPHRDEQIKWIESVRPRFAVIAAGEPSHAAQFKNKGIEPIYIAPNEDLLKLALDLCVEFIILEGAESGGHVGIHSTMTLAQMWLSFKDRNPGLAQRAKIVLAGGIFNRLTAFMAAMVGADAIQMGTVYLTCREIIQTGALSEVYQKVVLDSEPGSTVVTGEGIGLRVRSVKTSRIEEICDLERDYSAGNRDEGAFRREIEALSAGSLFVAAKSMSSPGGSPLSDEEALDRGQFMCGACAGAIEEPRSLQDIHLDLAHGSPNEKFPGKAVLEGSEDVEYDQPGKRMTSLSGSKVCARVAKDYTDRERIAVTGMSVVNSLGNSPQEIWDATVGLRCGITEVPLEKWDHSEFYNPRPRVSEKTYCKFGAFQNLEVSRKELGIPPQDFKTMASAMKVTMWLAQKAIEESGIAGSDIPKERISVMISQNAGEAASTLEEMIIRASINKVMRDIKRAVQLSPEQEEAIAREITSGRLAVDDTTLLGRLNCSAGGFICNKYGFMGPSFSVSAACATSLVALYSAFQLIRNGIIDAAVIGGAEELLTPMHFLEFSALGALAGLSGVEREAFEVSRPFENDRDGMVLGEGGGMIVIERESVAIQRGARIHGFITGMGAGNNNRGMVESSRITQIPAIKASFESAGYGPETVQLVECHATSTKQGDIEEVQALNAVFGLTKTTWLASFKSQIGHTLGASGVNSLIRGIMAMNHGLIPPTLNYVKPDAEMELDKSCFKIASEPEPWPDTDGNPRRFEVNAFGFGGSNYVVQLEQNVQQQAQDLKAKVFGPPTNSPQNVDIPEVKGVVAYKTDISSKNYRIAVVSDSEAAAEKALEKNELFCVSDGFTVKKLKALGKQGIFVGESSEKTPPLAFVFPGQGSHYAGMGLELYNTFPVIRQWMNKAADVAEFDILKLLFYDKEEDLQKTRWQQPALFTLEYAMVQHLVSLGVKPDALAGHSLGELTALCLSGVYSFEDGFRLVNKRAICMDKACSINVDPGVMMACDAPLEVIDDLRRNKDKVYITNINSPNQIVIGGDTEQVREVGVRLKEEGYRSTLLRVSMAFHSPVMACIHDELEEFVAGIQFYPPKIPVISNTTMAPFTDDTEQTKKTVMAHLESCVNWMPNVRTLWNDHGIRLFVEVGPREILSNLILDTLPEAECVQTCLPSAEAMIFRNAIGRLYAKGALELKTSKAPGSSTQSMTCQSVAKAPLLSQATSTAVQSAHPVSPVERVINREIGSFVFQSFGRFIKPSLLESIRREVNPACTEAELDAILAQIFNLSKSEISASATLQPEVAIPAQPVLTSVAKSVAPATPAEKPDSDVIESVIQLIMGVTGYEREEIEPGMDLREDLSIRSSRLPVIMDAVEGHFAIKVELEEFMDVRTVKDLADRITSVLEKTNSKVSGKSDHDQTLVGEPGSIEKKVSEEKDDKLKRLIFRRLPLASQKVQPVELSPMDSVVIVSAATSDLCKQVGDAFRRDYGVNILHWNMLENEWAESYMGSDLRSSDGVAAMCEKLDRLESVSGLVVVIDQTFNSYIKDPSQLSGLLTGYFLVLKKFLESKSKKLAFTVRKADGIAEVLEEGILGMFLTGALEFSSVQFRSLSLEQGYELRSAMRSALDRNYKPIRMISSESEILTESGFVDPLVFESGERMQLSGEDVIVISGGCSGITSSLALGLSVFKPIIVFIGRTKLESTNSTKTLEILESLDRLKAQGVLAHYYSCDVTDVTRTKEVLDQITLDHGCITGIIHGAGYLKDSFIKQMSEEDFKGVVDVKYTGALNLFRSVDSRKLKFFFSLSSAAAVQGNPGQVNYSSGNRMMSSLGEFLSQEHRSTKFKALELPPVEGAGMAENEEIRSLMRRMNAGYITLEELSAMFMRELIVSTPGDATVLFMKTLPSLSSAPIDASGPEENGENFVAGSVSFKQEQFPSVGFVRTIDFSNGILEAERIFDQSVDLWIPDHKPFKFLKKPLVSAIMALETFMEAAQILYPDLHVRGVRDAKFLDIIEVGPTDRKIAKIHCRRMDFQAGEVAVEATMEEIGSSSVKRSGDKAYPNYKAMVILDSGNIPGHEMKGFPVNPDELDTIPLNQSEVQAWYAQRSDLMGRYRVMDSVQGTAHGAIRGVFVYPSAKDFRDYPDFEYTYSPYLMEAFMHVINFYGALRDPSEIRSLIPFAVGSLTQLRKCNPGERIVVEARRNSIDEKGVSWNARGLDESGSVVMFAQNVMMRWFKM